MTADIPTSPPVSPTVEQTLKQATAHHQSGRLQEAEMLYLALLSSYPNHPEASYRMGCLAVQKKQPAASLPYLMAALDADPTHGQYWLSYIDALHQAGQLEDARQVLELALQHGLQGKDVDTLVVRLNNIGQCVEQLSAECGGGSKDLSLVSPVSSRSGKKNSKITPNKRKKSAMKFVSHQEGSPSHQEMNELLTLFTAGLYAEAEVLAQMMTVRFPLHGFAWKALGLSLQRQGKDALHALKKATELLPDEFEAHNNLGAALQELGRFDDAVASYRRALELKPDFAEAHNNMGNALQDNGQLNEAVVSYRRALEIKPDFAVAHNNFGSAQLLLGQLDDAMVSFRQALQITPEYADAHNNLAGVLLRLGKHADAMASYRRALEIKPDFADAHNSLGVVLQALDCHDDAISSYLRGLELKPDFAGGHLNIGNVLKDLGQHDEAVVRYRRTLEIDPSFAEAHSNLIFALDLAANENMAELLEERKQWDLAHAAPLWQKSAHTNAPVPTRRLRIGYVSADFRKHSAARVFGGMLTRYDRSQFDVFAYSNYKGKDDELTELFRQNVTAWRNIVGLSDEAVAKRICEDQIDILVDLSGHTAGNRLLVFARKPAPIQITAWGYATGTGMRAMDVFFTDPVMVPPQDKKYFSEEIRYLPSAVGSFSLESYPEVNELPALSNGIVTFGSFNRLAKVSEDVYRVWAEVLLAVPRSRLILKAPEFSDHAVRESALGHFLKAGVAADRVIFQGRTSWHEHMQAYRQIDIALDSFPHGGGVTTLEASVMGVPTITLRWPTIAGRISASIMTTLGQPDWIAENLEEYVGLAIQKAADLQSLAALRRGLRIIFAASVLGDQAAYARAVEREYRQLWQEWCARRLPAERE